MRCCKCVLWMLLSIGLLALPVHGKEEAEHGREVVEAPKTEKLPPLTESAERWAPPPPEGLKDWAEIVRTLALTGGFILGAIGIWLAVRRTRSLERQTEVDANRLTHQSEEDKQKRYTDNFTRAVDQLGAEQIEARLGAIYALVRIARESKEDHWPIMETLTAYVRQRSPWESTSAVDRDGSEQTTRPSIDLQAVMTVIGRRNPDLEGDRQQIDLSNANLQRMSLGGGCFQSADFRNSSLVRSDFGDANLRMALFVGASLQVANLKEAKIEGAKLNAANMNKAEMAGANLEGAELVLAELRNSNLRRANLRSVDLWNAELQGADLTEANLREALCHGANLEGANLRGANLERAELVDAILTGANLSNANLQGINLGGAKLANATLTEADIRGSDLSDAIGLTWGQLEDTVFDENTRLPVALGPKGLSAE